MNCIAAAEPGSDKLQTCCDPMPGPAGDGRKQNPYETFVISVIGIKSERYDLVTIPEGPLANRGIGQKICLNFLFHVKTALSIRIISDARERS